MADDVRGHSVAVEDSKARPDVAAKAHDEAVDPDLSAAVSHSLQQTVGARLRGVRNYTRLLREVQGSR